MQCGCIAIETFPCDGCGNEIKNASRYLLVAEGDARKRLCIKCGLTGGLAYIVGERKATSALKCDRCNAKIKPGATHIPGVSFRVGGEKRKLDLCMKCALDKEFLDRYPSTTVSLLPRLPVQKPGSE